MVDLTLTRDNCLVKVREGCAAVAHRATHVAISEERLAEFAQAINAEEVRAAYGSDIQVPRLAKTIPVAMHCKARQCLVMPSSKQCQ